MTSKTEREGQERSARNILLIQAELSVVDGAGPYPVLVRNLSAGGMMVEGFPGLEPQVAVLAEIPGVGGVGGTIAWVEAGRAGVSFVTPINPDLVLVGAEPASRAGAKGATNASTKRPRLRSI